MNRYKRSFFISILALMVLIVLHYPDYQASKQADQYADAFRNNLKHVMETQQSFRMTDVATFEWDRMYMLPPYLAKAHMEQTVGTKWKSNHELTDDSLHKLVFVKGDRVVLDLTLDRWFADFTQSKTMTERDESFYVIEKTEDTYRDEKQLARENIVIRNAAGP